MTTFLLRGPRQRATIVHPKHPEVTVTVEKPTMKEVSAWEKETKKYMVRNPVINPETKKPFRDKNGVPIMEPPRLDVPLEVTLETMSKFVTNVTGFADAPFNPNDPELVQDMLRELLDSRFNWEAVEDQPVLNDEGEEEVNEDGSVMTRKAKVQHNYYHYVMNRLFKQETYEPPLAGTSEHSATPSSE